MDARFSLIEESEGMGLTPELSIDIFEVSSARVLLEVDVELARFRAANARASRASEAEACVVVGSVDEGVGAESTGFNVTEGLGVIELEVSGAELVGAVPVVEFVFMLSLEGCAPSGCL